MIFNHLLHSQYFLLITECRTFYQINSVCACVPFVLPLLVSIDMKMLLSIHSQSSCGGCSWCTCGIVLEQVLMFRNVRCGCKMGASCIPIRMIITVYNNMRMFQAQLASSLILVIIYFCYLPCLWYIWLVSSCIFEMYMNWYIYSFFSNQVGTASKTPKRGWPSAGNRSPSRAKSPLDAGKRPSS